MAMNALECNKYDNAVGEVVSRTSSRSYSSEVQSSRVQLK